MKWLCSLLVLLAACAHHPAPSAPAEPALRARDLYPLKVGNQWTYEARANGQKTQETVQIVGEKDGYFVDNKGGALKQDTTGLRDEHRYLIENPVTEGHKWFSVLSVRSTEHFEITDAGHPCSTQAGTFGQCATVQATTDVGNGRTLVLESTYAEGVGLVSLRTSQIVDKHDPVPVLELELVSYKFPP